MRFKRILVVPVLVIAMMLNSVSAIAATTPKLINVNPNGAEGDYYVGETPKNVDPSKPVIVFVHGMGGNAKSWWESSSDAYNYAYNSGYRTAFVNFRDADGNPGDMWLNGSVLAKQLEQICEYYKVNKVNLVCHSKGGVDSTSAIAHFGADEYVDKVFTLSSPHWGSPLADLSYTWYASWLAKLMGHRNDATYVLQTAYMENFREQTDDKPGIKTVSYFTGAGTDDGKLFSSTWFGNLYLESYGPNDGVVLVESSKLPFGKHVFTGKFDHFSIKSAKNTWKYIEPIIGTYSDTSGALSSFDTRDSSFQKIILASNSPFDFRTIANAFSVMPVISKGEEKITKISNNHKENMTSKKNQNIKQEEINDTLLRGGEFQGDCQIEFAVESSVKSINLDLIASNSDIKLTIISPDNRKYTFNNPIEDTGVFEGAFHFMKTVKNPKAGNWKIQMNSNNSSAYFLNVKYDSPLKAKLAFDKNKFKRGEKIKFGIEMNNTKNTSENIDKNKKIKTVISKSLPGTKLKKIKEVYSEKVGMEVSENIEIPSEEGVYNICTDIKGTLEDGSTYERTLVKSIIVE